MSARLLIVGLLAAVVSSGACGSGSCVQFDGQSILARHDADRDRLDLLLIYRDLHTTGDPAEALAQLESIRDGERTFALAANFPLLFAIDGLTREKRRADRPADAALLDALQARTTVRSGPLWRDSQGRVCGSQLVRLDGLGALLAAINAALREELSRPDELERFAAEARLEDDESLARLRAAVAGGFTFAGLRGSAPWFALPVSDVGFIALKRGLFDAWATDAEPKGPGAGRETRTRALLEALAVNDWTLERSPGVVTFVLGTPDATTVELTVPPIGRAEPGVPDVLARRALADTLRPRGWTIGGPDGEATARAAFEAFTREP